MNLKLSTYFFAITFILMSNLFLSTAYAGEMTKNFIVKGQGQTIFGPGSIYLISTDSNKNVLLDSTGTIYIYDPNFEKIIDYFPKEVDFIYDGDRTKDKKYLLFEEASTISCFDTDACKILWREKLKLKNKYKMKWKSKNGKG